MSIIIPIIIIINSNYFLRYELFSKINSLKIAIDVSGNAFAKVRELELISGSNLLL